MKLRGSTQTQQWLAFFVPIIALLISIIVVYPAWGHHGDLGRRIGQTGEELRKLQLAAVPSMNQGIPVAAPSPGEWPQYVADMRGVAALAGCLIKGYDNAASGDTSLPVPGLRAIRTKVTLNGTYRQIRTFLSLISHHPRFFSVTDASLVLDETTFQESGRPLTANITIERYLEAPITAAPAAAASGSSVPGGPL